MNSPYNRYTLANSQSPYVLKETFFYTESTTVNPNLTNHHQSSSNSPAPVIVTRTLSTSNVRNASSTIVQTTPTNCSTPSIQLPNLYPRTSSPSVGVVSSYHPITTEL